MPRRLDYWAKEDTLAWLDEREDWIFERYLELGRVNDVIKELAPQCNGLTGHTFYAWIRHTDDREERWSETVKLRGFFSAEEADAIAQKATQQTANADRLKAEYRMKAAEWQNRDVFGKRPDVQVAVGVGGEWAQALEALFEKKGGHLSAQPATRATPDQKLLPPARDDDG